MNLVIGGTGLVGSHLLLELLSREEEVKVLTRRTSSKKQILRTFGYYTTRAEELYSKISWVEGDILDYASVVEAIKGVTHIYHCAAMVSFSPKNRKLLLKTNVDGTANVVNACLKYPGIKLCFVSSIAALGHSESTEKVTEAHTWKADVRRSIYSLSKFRSEMEVWRGMEEGLQAVIVNPSVIIGPGNWANSSSAFFPTVYNGIKFYTNGMTGFVDVRDVVKSMVMLMKSPVKNDRFIISAANVTFRELFFMIADALHVKRPRYEATPAILQMASKLDGLRSLITFSKRKISDDTIAAAVSRNEYCNRKIVDTLNFEFRPIEQTIKECADMFLHHMWN